MNDDKFEEALQECFNTKYEMDERIKRRAIYLAREKEKNIENLLVIVTQILMFLLISIIIIICCIIAKSLLLVAFVLVYILLCSVIAGVVIIKYKKFDEVL